MKMSRSRRILLVEDQPADAGLITVLLRVGKSVTDTAAPTVIWARSLAEAKAETERDTPDVILLDLSLPDSRGIATIETVHGWFPDTPIVVLTAHEDVGLSIRALEAGAQDYLVKGDFDPKDLARTLRHALARSQLEERVRLQEIALNAAPNAIVITDPHDRIQWINPAFTTMTGFTLADSVGRTRDDLAAIANGDEPSAPDTPELGLHAKPISAGDTSGEFVRQRKDGSRYDEEHRVTPVRDRHGHLLHHVAVCQDITERKRTEALFKAINALQTSFIAGKKLGESFGRMLEMCLSLTDSEFGFIGEVERREDDTPYLKIHAISNIAWNDETRRLYDTLEQGGLELTRIDSLFGAVLTSATTVIANSPGTDPRSGGLPPGHPPLHAFAGLPIFGAGEFVAVIGLANRPAGYDESVAGFLKPLLSACGSVIADHRAKQLLRANQQRLATLLASIQDMVLIISSEGLILDHHTADPSMLGADSAPQPGQNYRAVLPANVAKQLDEALASIRRDGDPREFEYVLYLSSGEHHFHATANKLLDSGSSPEGFVVIIHDITQRVRSESSLRIAATAFESQECMMITDAKHSIRSVNPSFTRTTGYDSSDVVGLTPGILDPKQHDGEFLEAMWDCAASFGSWQGEVHARRKNGETFPAWLSITAVHNRHGTITDYVCALADITDRKLAEERIRYLAYYDMLTHLPNRRLLIDRLKQALLARRHTGREGALFFIDLDHFKNLNDTLGHDTGDMLLKDVAARILTCVREADTVARLGGDEFVVMLEGLSMHPDDAVNRAEAIAQKVLATLNEPYELMHHEYHITPSIGVTMFSDLADTVDELLKRADLAMYQAKAAGRNTIRFFNPQMQANIEARSLLEADLRHALAANEFALHYQAQIDLDGTVTGAEALLRWVHPIRGAISPEKFIPLAEDTGIIITLGQWVLDTACAQLATWHRQPDLSHLTLSVNVSARQFRHTAFVDQVIGAIKKASIPAEKLKLELTESLLLDDLESAVATMTALRKQGVTFSLDDFGTGYSSLSYLKRLPLEQLKIDKSFVRDILTDPNDEVIARTIVALGHSLGLTVIAEGVETTEQHALLAQQGCNAFQGYLFARPVPVEAFDASPRTRPTAG